ncbi:hypothetical protein [Microbacterium sp. NPDC079995]|uniref:hypothetical protein n=1 Tax=unclassified Microbacterium TaxID=2609290 RepID=UPI003450B162
MDPETARRTLERTRFRESAMRAIAALDSWRTLTVEQLEAITDIAQATEGKPSLIAALWTVGLIDLCLPAASFSKVGTERDSILVRPGRDKKAAKQFQDSLSWVEWVSVTSGLGLDSDRQYARHNVLAAEFGLRVAETGRVATVLGEKLSTMAMLAYSGVGAPVPSSGASNGSDLTLVRDDGLRIAVEITASKVGRWFDDKVEKLVTILARRSLSETGLSILFATAPQQDASRSEASVAEQRVKAAVQRAVFRNPGTFRDPTARRVAVANWRTLFPAPGTVNANISVLPAEQPTGRGYLGSDRGRDVWEPIHLLDAAMNPFEAKSPSALTAVIDNAAGLRGVPHMLRESQNRPSLSDRAMERLDMARLLHVDGTSLTAARGASGPRQIPSRLRY